MAKTCSTGDAAKKIGVSRQTLQAWIDSKSIPTPKLEKVGRVSIRLWTNADIKRARKFKGTLKPGRKLKPKR
jgi:DNA-binding transcriptional MerR regulator